MLPSNKPLVPTRNGEAPLLAAQRRRLATTMKTMLPFALVLSLVPVAYADISVVKGELTFNSVGIGQLMECGTRRVIEFGTMASTPYFQFRKQYERASDDGKRPVLVEVQGALAHSSAGKLVLENPSVIALASGTCGNG